MNTAKKEKPLIHPHITYYFQLSNQIRLQIDNGDLREGEKLPKEVDLARIYNISRVPVRQALGLLEKDGLIVRKRGKGTFVKIQEEDSTAVRLSGILAKIKNKNTTRKILSMNTRVVNKKIADYFSSENNFSLSVFKRVISQNDKPYCFTCHYVPSKIGKQINRKQMKEKNMLEILNKDLGFEVGNVKQEFEARNASNEVAKVLSLSVMSPILFVKTFVADKQGNPIEYSEIFYPGDTHRYSIELEYN